MRKRRPKVIRPSQLTRGVIDDAEGNCRSYYTCILYISPSYWHLVYGLMPNYGKNAPRGQHVHGFLHRSIQSAFDIVPPLEQGAMAFQQKPKSLTPSRGLILILRTHLEGAAKKHFSEFGSIYLSPFCAGPPVVLTTTKNRCLSTCKTDRGPPQTDTGNMARCSYMRVGRFIRFPGSQSLAESSTLSAEPQIVSCFLLSKQQTSVKPNPGIDTRLQKDEASVCDAHGGAKLVERTKA